MFFLRSSGWTWSLEGEGALGQGLLDCRLVTWKQVVSKKNSFSRTFAERHVCSAEYARELFVSQTFAEVLVGTGPQKKCAGMFLTGDFLAAIAEVDARKLQQARDRAEFS